MHQRIDIGADLREQAHVTPDTPDERAPHIGGSCQRPLKRTLRQVACGACTAGMPRNNDANSIEFVSNGERSVAERRRHEGMLQIRRISSPALLCCSASLAR